MKQLLSSFLPFCKVVRSFVSPQHVVLELAPQGIWCPLKIYKTVLRWVRLRPSSLGGASQVLPPRFDLLSRRGQKGQTCAWGIYKLGMCCVDFNTVSGGVLPTRTPSPASSQLSFLLTFSSPPLVPSVIFFSCRLGLATSLQAVPEDIWLA